MTTFENDSPFFLEKEATAGTVLKSNLPITYLDLFEPNRVEVDTANTRLEHELFINQADLLNPSSLAQTYCTGWLWKPTNNQNYANCVFNDENIPGIGSRHLLIRIPKEGSASYYVADCLACPLEPVCSREIVLSEVTEI